MNTSCTSFGHVVDVDDDVAVIDDESNGASFSALFFLLSVVDIVMKDDL